jgi:chemotaxis methyl-accepting protein methylase
MQDARIDNYREYLEKLSSDGDEFAELFDTILINVTGFFRDPPAWAFMRETIVPKILAEKGPGEQVRIWSAGCATGEEAYSLAMVFAEQVGDENFAERVKIYATDIDASALSDARQGIFTAESVEGVPADLRGRYFEPADGRFVFSSDLRRAVIFGRNDLLVDPPISRLDLISTRNTLMYFNAASQRQILLNFHFALLPTGYLFLGRSEALLTTSHLFVPVDLKKRVFAKGVRDEMQEQLREMIEGERGAPVQPAQGERLQDRALRRDRLRGRRERHPECQRADRRTRDECHHRRRSKATAMAPPRNDVGSAYIRAPASRREVNRLTRPPSAPGRRSRAGTPDRGARAPPA